jgi:hypothetical protein
MVIEAGTYLPFGLWTILEILIQICLKRMVPFLVTEARSVLSDFDYSNPTLRPISIAS